VEIQLRWIQLLQIVNARLGGGMRKSVTGKLTDDSDQKAPGRA